MARAKATPEAGKMEMRDSFCRTMMDLARHDSRIMVIDDDCSHSMGTGPFMAQFPEQYLNPGIMEAHMIGLAAGMSSEGFVPFVNAFGAFAGRRAFDQVFLSCGYAGLNVKILGWDPGICAVSNGGTHMPFEDMGVMRNVPDIIVAEPADATALAALVRAAAVHPGNVYIRTMRRTVPDVYEKDSQFEFGKAELLREGGDVSIIACGLLVAEALLAADDLAKKGIRARVVDMHTIKPLDETMVLDCARATGCIVTAENHNHSGGLAAAVSQCLVENLPVPLERVAVENRYGEVGDLPYLKSRFRLNREHVVEKVEAVLKRK